MPVHFTNYNMFPGTTHNHCPKTQSSIITYKFTSRWELLLQHTILKLTPLWSLRCLQSFNSINTIYYLLPVAAWYSNAISYCKYSTWPSCHHVTLVSNFTYDDQLREMEKSVFCIINRGAWAREVNQENAWAPNGPSNCNILLYCLYFACEVLRIYL